MLNRPTSRFALGLVAGALATACAGEVVESTRVEEPEARMAMLTFEAVNERTTGVFEAPLEASSSFVAYRGLDPRSVESALDVWRPLQIEGCVILDPPPEASPSASLDLLSAGGLTLVGNGGAATFRPQLFAGGPRMSGFTYAPSEVIAAPTWAPGEPYTVRAGGDEVGAFSVSLRAPEDVRLVAINGVDLGSASESYVGGNDVEIELYSESPEVFVSLNPLLPFGAPRAECRFGSVATARFDAIELARAFGSDTDLELTVRTATAAPLPAEAGIAGDAVISVVDRVILRR